MGLSIATVGFCHSIKLHHLLSFISFRLFLGKRQKLDTKCKDAFRPSTVVTYHCLAHLDYVKLVLDFVHPVTRRKICVSHVLCVLNCFLCKELRSFLFIAFLKTTINAIISSTLWNCYTALLVYNCNIHQCLNTYAQTECYLFRPHVLLIMSPLFYIFTDAIIQAEDLYIKPCCPYTLNYLLPILILSNNVVS